ncbi:MAG: phosphoglycerate mutase [Rhodoferax sp.]|nr:phosphoglycerate mutase [Rhodoferax sp.]
MIPYAGPPGPECRQAIARLQLPHLDQLLRLVSADAALLGGSEHLTPLHERVWAQSLGLEAADGLVPWAAWDALRLGLCETYGQTGWAWITPCHWKLHTSHIDMADPLQLALSPQESVALCEAMQAYFAEDGITLFAHALGHPVTHWLAHGDVLRDLPTASLDRVAGQAVDAWMPRSSGSQLLRRLQNEMQMLLYTHPINDARASAALPVVNSFWISGTGSLPAGVRLPDADTPHIECLRTLTGPARSDNASAWIEAWETIDRTALAQALERVRAHRPVKISVCADNKASTLGPTPHSVLRRLQLRFAAPPSQALLHSL